MRGAAVALGAILSACDLDRSPDGFDAATNLNRDAVTADESPRVCQCNGLVCSGICTECRLASRVDEAIPPSSLQAPVGGMQGQCEVPAIPGTIEVTWDGGQAGFMPRVASLSGSVSAVNATEVQLCVLVPGGVTTCGAFVPFIRPAADVAPSPEETFFPGVPGPISYSGQAGVVRTEIRVRSCTTFQGPNCNVVIRSGARLTLRHRGA